MSQLFTGCHTISVDPAKKVFIAYRLFKLNSKSKKNTLILALVPSLVQR